MRAALAVTPVGATSLAAKGRDTDGNGAAGLPFHCRRASGGRNLPLLVCRRAHLDPICRLGDPIRSVSGPSAATCSVRRHSSLL